MKKLFCILLILSYFSSYGQNDTVENEICKQRGHVIGGIISVTAAYCPSYIIDTDSTTIRVYPSCNIRTYTYQRCGKLIKESEPERRVVIWRKVKIKNEKKKHFPSLPAKGSNEIIIGCQPAYTGKTIHIGYYPSNPPQFPLYNRFGLKALNENTGGNHNTAYGMQSAYETTTGTFSIPFGTPDTTKTHK